MSVAQDKKNGVEFVAEQGGGGGGAKVEDAANGEAPAEKKDKRVTTRFMTKYERARILGTRALQIR